MRSTDGIEQASGGRRPWFARLSVHLRGAVALGASETLETLNVVLTRRAGGAIVKRRERLGAGHLAAPAERGVVVLPLQSGLGVLREPLARISLGPFLGGLAYYAAEED
jgi:hypothetical protein